MARLQFFYVCFFGHMLTCNAFWVIVILNGIILKCFVDKYKQRMLILRSVSVFGLIIKDLTSLYMGREVNNFSAVTVAKRMPRRNKMQYFK